MNIFDFDPADYRGHYAEHGWVHIPGGISSDFLGELRDFVERSFGSHKVEGTAIGGSKDQALFEFPEATDYPGELFASIASLCGLDLETMTLSERHVKAYFDDTPAEQLPHKDRFASQVSVGLSIDIPEDSELVLYPRDQVSPNPYNISGALPASLRPGERPEDIAKSAEEVVIDDSPGDVIAFRGSAIWHARRLAAGATNVYLKLNDFDCDPLGEDPATQPRREATLAALDAENGIGELVPVLARRFDQLRRVRLRDGSAEVEEAQVFDRTPLQLDQREVELIKAVDGSQSAGEVASDSGDEERLRRLAREEVIDLLEG